MVRAAAKNHANVAVVTSPARVRRGARGAARGRLHARRSASRSRREAFAHTADVRHRGRVMARQPRARRADGGSGWPEWVGAALDPGAGAALRREPAPAGGAVRRRRPAGRAGQARAAARQGDVVQQLRRRRRRAACRATTSPSRRRDHQAREPVRHRGRRGHRRGAPQGARLRPGVGVRWRDRHQPHGDRRDGRADGRHLHRGHRRPGYDDDAVGACSRRRRTCDCCGARARTPAARIECARSAAAAAADRRTTSTPPATTPRPGPWRAATRPTPATLADLEFAWRAVPRGEVQRDPARQRRRLGRGRHGPGEPGRLGPARGGAGGRRAGPRVGGGVRRLLPVRRRACRCCSTPACAPSSSPAGRCATTRSSPRLRPPASRCTSPARGTSSTEPAPVGGLGHDATSARR